MPGGLFGGGGGGGTSSQPVGAQSYIPQAQATADQGFQNIAHLFYDPSIAGTTPGQAYYPQVQSSVAAGYNNPYAPGAQSAAVNYDALAQGAVPGITSGGTNLVAGGALPLSDLQLALAGGFAPDYSNIVSLSETNPYLQQAQQGASWAAGLGRTAADQAAQGGVQLGGVAAQLPGLGAQAGQQITALGSPLQGLASSLINTGFDPQQALYNRTQQQVLDQANAVNAASGLSGTPYGAGVTDQTLSNFNIDWQNNLQNRQLAAAQGAQGVQNTLGGLIGSGLQANVLGANAAGSLFNTGLGLGQGATGLMAGAQSLPSAQYGNNLQSIIQALNARNQAGNVGATTAQGLLGGAGNALTQGAGGLSTGLNLGSQYSQLPYNVFNQNIGNQLSTLGQGINLGNQQYTVPQQTLNNLEDYLGLGQSATGSAISGQYLNNATNLLSGQGLGGLASTLFGNSLGGGSGGLLGQVGLNPFTSSGLGLTGGLAGLGDAGTSDMGLLAGLGGDFGGGGDVAASVLPSIFSIFSDRRLKTDVEPIGMAMNGLPLYAYRYKGTGLGSIGVMADEVERINPDAVLYHPSGYKMVDYARALW